MQWISWGISRWIKVGLVISCVTVSALWPQWRVELQSLDYVNPSLLFREKSGDEKDGTWGRIGIDFIPGFDHIGLHISDDESGEDVVFESHPGYNPGIYTDQTGMESVPIQNNFGVQAQHTRGTFEYDAFPSEPSPVTRFDSVAIPAQLGSDMRTEIEGRLGDDFQLINLSDLSTLAPNQQKGGGGTFTCVGLIEWAAEQAGHNSGRGFIPNRFESIGPLPLLSPQLLNYAVRVENAFNSSRNILINAQDWIQGFFDPVDFIITDPLGRMVGYSPSTGELNEVPRAFYSGNGDMEQFLIPNPTPGVYILEIIGLSDNTTIGINTATDTFTFEGLLEQDERIIRTIALGDDICPGSNLEITVVIDSCDSRVQNVINSDGCTISDYIDDCATINSNHGQFVKCVAGVTNSLKKDRVINGKEKGAIQSYAAKANIP